METGWLRDLWEEFHGTLIAVTLGGAVLLTVYSLGVYLYRYRRLFRAPPVPTGRSDGS